jgi:DNA polymerase III delta subunit
MSEPQLVLLFGNPFLCEQELAQRQRRLAPTDSDVERIVLYGDDIRAHSLQIELASLSLFPTFIRHFVIRRIEEANLVERKKVISLLSHSLPAATFITILTEETKKMSLLYRTVAKYGAVIESPKPKQLAPLVRQIFAEHKLSILPGAIKVLLERSQGDLIMIANEAAKMRSFAPADGKITVELASKFFFCAGEWPIYPFLDQLGMRNLRATIGLLSEATHEDPHRLFFALSHHLRRLLTVKLLVDERLSLAQIATTIGQPEWLLRRHSGQAKSFSRQELIFLLDKGITLDMAIKSGRIRPQDALLTLLLLALTVPQAQVTSPWQPIQSSLRGNDWQQAR